MKLDEEAWLDEKDVGWVVPVLKMPARGLLVVALAKRFEGWLTPTLVVLFVWLEKRTEPDLGVKDEVENAEGFLKEEDSIWDVVPGNVAIVVKGEVELRFDEEDEGFPAWRGVFAICPNEGSWLNSDLEFFGAWNMVLSVQIILAEKEIWKVCQIRSLKGTEKKLLKNKKTFPKHLQ